MISKRIRWGAADAQGVFSEALSQGISRGEVVLRTPDERILCAAATAPSVRYASLIASVRGSGLRPTRIGRWEMLAIQTAQQLVPPHYRSILTGCYPAPFAGVVEELAPLGAEEDYANHRRLLSEAVGMAPAGESPLESPLLDGLTWKDGPEAFVAALRVESNSAVLGRSGDPTEQTARSFVLAEGILACAIHGYFSPSDQGERRSDLELCLDVASRLNGGLPAKFASELWNRCHRDGADWEDLSVQIENAAASLLERGRGSGSILPALGVRASVGTRTSDLLDDLASFAIDFPASLGWIGYWLTRADGARTNAGRYLDVFRTALEGRSSGAELGGRLSRILAGIPEHSHRSQRPLVTLPPARPQLVVEVSGQARGFKYATPSFELLERDFDVKYVVSVWEDTGRKAPYPYQPNRAYPVPFWDAWTQLFTAKGWTQLASEFPNLCAERGTQISASDVLAVRPGAIVDIEPDGLVPSHWTNQHKMLYKIHRCHEISTDAYPGASYYMRIRPDRHLMRVGDDLAPHLARLTEQAPGGYVLAEDPFFYHAETCDLLPLIDDQVAIGPREAMDTYCGTWLTYHEDWRQLRASASAPEAVPTLIGHTALSRSLWASGIVRQGLRDFITVGGYLEEPVTPEYLESQLRLDLAQNPSQDAEDLLQTVLSLST